MKILPIQIQKQKELFQCASSWTVEHCSHPCQAGGIRQQIQERVQEAQGQDDCRLACTRSPGPQLKLRWERHTYTETDSLQAVLTGPRRVNDQHINNNISTQNIYIYIFFQLFLTPGSRTCPGCFYFMYRYNIWQDAGIRTLVLLRPQPGELPMSYTHP